MRELLIEKFEKNKFVVHDDTFLTGEMIYWLDDFGQFHRGGDKPAVIWSDERKHWYKNGIMHRSGGRPASIYSNGDKHWIENGKIIKCITKGKLYFYNNI